MDEFAFKFYLNVLRKWIIVILIVVMVTGGITYNILDRRTPLYDAKTLITIGGFLQSPDPEINDVRVSLELTQTYARLVETSTILQNTIDNLGLEISTGKLRSLIDTIHYENTSLLEIHVLNEDPEIAAQIANEISNQLILNSPSNLTPRMESQRLLAEEQIERLNSQLPFLENELADINLILTETRFNTDDEFVSTMRSRRQVLVQQITDIIATTASFSNMIATIERGINSVNLVESAEIPTTPVNQNTKFFTLLSIVGSSAFIIGIVILREALDTRLKNKNQAVEWLEMQLRGTLPIVSKTLADVDRHSDILREFQFLYANLMYQAGGKQKTAYIIASATNAEQRELLLVNFAMTVAQSEVQILLVDMNFRDSKIMNLLNADYQYGFTDLLESQTKDVKEKLLRKAIYQTEIDNLHIIKNGSISKDTVQLMDSETLYSWFQDIIELLDYDIVLINTSPILSYPDTIFLASNSGFDVLLIVERTKTDKEKVIQARDSIIETGGRFGGIIYHGKG